MSITIGRVSRRPEWPIWAVGAFVLWVALGVGTIWLAEATGHDVTLCAFKRLTGLACPTCGVTRSAGQAIQGNVVGAFLMQPLMVIVIGAFLLLTGLRVAFGRRIHLEMAPVTRRACIGLFVAAAVANWVYVINVVG